MSDDGATIAQPLGSMGGDPLGIPGIVNPTAIGRGGFGVVYKATRPALSRTVAVKVATSSVTDEDSRVRFEREGMAMGMLSGHPNIVTVYGQGFTADAKPYIEMEFLPNGSLGDLIARDGPLPWAQVLRIGVRVCGALETAHRSGVLHRDIKPENILLSAYGEPMLGDFGIARVKGGWETMSAGLTASMAHVPPELIQGAQPEPASDIYSLGSTLFTLLAGYPPFAADGADTSFAALAYRAVHEAPPDLRRLGVPDLVCGLVEQALAKEPGRRFASAAVFGSALQHAQEALGQARSDIVVEQAGPLPTLEAPPPPRLPTGPGPTSPVPPPMAAPPAAGGGKKWLAPAIGIAALVVAVIVIAAVVSSGGKGKTEDTVTTTTAAGAETTVTAAGPTTSAGPSPTEQITFNPFQDVNTVAPDLTVTQTVSGDCFSGSSSVGRRDAWRCGFGDQLIDPCISSTGADFVVCVEDPFAKKVIKMNLTADLDFSSANEDDPTKQPFAVVMASGAQCRRITGVSGDSGGERLNYGCDDGTNLFGDVDTSGAVWTVLAQAPGTSSNTRQPIATAIR